MTIAVQNIPRSRSFTDGADNASTGFYYVRSEGGIDYYDIVNTLYGLGGNDTLTAISPTGYRNGVGYATFGDAEVTYSISALYGGDGNDVLNGGSGMDQLQGDAGADTLLGGAGNDLLFEYDAGSVLNGGDGDDRLEIDRARSSGLFVQGGAGNDIIVGGTSTDVLDGGSGDDTLEINGWDISSTTITNIEHLRFANGVALRADQLNAFVDVGRAFGGGGLTVTTGGTVGANFLPDIGSSQGNSSLVIAAFADAQVQLGHQTGNWGIYGNSGNDVLIAGGGNDVLYGGDGNDTLSSGAGNDLLSGGNGVDLLIGGDGSDDMRGGAGTDVLTGQAGNDQLYGDEENDTLIGGDGADLLNGGDGTDYAFYGNSTAVTVNLSTGLGTGGEAEGDTYVSIEGITGSEFADNLTGNALANELVGGGGNDVLEGLAGGDVLVGGAGIDTASYASSDDTVAVNLTNLSGAGGHAAGDILVGIENVTGSAYGDLLRGDAGANVLFGAAGGDLLFGEAGDDVLVGGAGGDIMTGGAGNDTFLFRPEFEMAGDIVVDFDQNGDDVLMFSGFGAGFAASLQTAVVNGSDVVVHSAAWDSHVVLQNAVGRVDASDFLFV